MFADLGGGLIRRCGPHGSGVAAVAQLSQCKASVQLETDAEAKSELMVMFC